MLTHAVRSRDEVHSVPLQIVIIVYHLKYHDHIGEL